MLPPPTNFSLLPIPSRQKLPGALYAGGGSTDSSNISPSSSSATDNVQKHSTASSSNQAEEPAWLSPREQKEAALPVQASAPEEAASEAPPSSEETPEHQDAQAGPSENKPSGKPLTLQEKAEGALCRREEPSPETLPTTVPSSDITKAAQKAVDYVKDQRFKENQAACNIGVYYAFQQLTGNTELNDKSANRMLDIIHHSSDWYEIPMSNAQETVNKGGIVIAGTKNEGGHGHIVLLVPGNEFNSGKWKDLVPVAMDTGEQGKWASKGISYSWTEVFKGKVKFFVYKGPIHKE